MNGRKVLIAHAAGVMRKIVKSTLATHGFEVVGEASSGLQAIDEYRALLPDVVTMDMVLPDLDGTGAVKAIVTEFPDAQIIMCTGTNQPELVLAALQAGAKSFITKPFPPVKLVEAILKMMANAAA